MKTTSNANKNKLVPEKLDSNTWPHTWPEFFFLVHGKQNWKLFKTQLQILLKSICLNRMTDRQTQKFKITITLVCVRLFDIYSLHIFSLPRSRSSELPACTTIFFYPRFVLLSPSLSSCGVLVKMQSWGCCAFSWMQAFTHTHRLFICQREGSSDHRQQEKEKN